MPRPRIPGSALQPGGPPTAAPPAGVREPLPPAPAPAPAKGLPADAPKVVIAGGVYSPNPRHRMAIINGQVLREGGEIVPGLVLEQITATDVVLGFRGGHYRVMF